MNSDGSRFTSKIREFVRGDLPTIEFEKWCYADKDLEKFLGGDLYLSVIETDFKTDTLVWKLKDDLKGWVEKKFPKKCNCCIYKNNQVVGIGYENYVFVKDNEYDFYRFFEVLKNRSNWVELVRCKTCGEHWYVAIDTVDDDIYFKRLKSEEINAILNQGKWPSDYDKMKHVW